MIARRRLDPWFLEVLLAGTVVASLAWTVQFFRENGFLPQPFVYDTNDTFMDWFNPGYWAHHRGAFEVWRSIYPPLSFAFLKAFTLPGCYLQSPFQGRDCDWLARATIGTVYLIDVVLVWIAFRRANARSAPMRTVAFALGLPLLFTLERGNLILVALAFFVVAHGEITQSKAWRAMAAALTINFKPYLMLPLLAHAVKRQWRMLELAGIATVAVYLLTLAIVGSGTPMEIIANTASWIEFQSREVLNEVNYSTSYAPLLRIGELQVPVLQFVASRTLETILFASELAIRTTQAVALVALAAAWLQPVAVTGRRVSTLLIGVYLVTTSPGGYAQVFLVFLVMLEPWRRPGPILALVCAYVLCLVCDWRIAPVMQISADSWLGGRSVQPVFGLTLGQFLRPALLIVIVWALAFDTVVEVARAHRRHRPVLGLSPG
jgi:hypothetical protein